MGFVILFHRIILYELVTVITMVISVWDSILEKLRTRGIEKFTSCDTWFPVKGR